MQSFFRSRKTTLRPRVQLGIERLEDRQLLDGSNFTSVALFYNLANPASTTNANGYRNSNAADVRSWLHEGEAVTTSQFMRNYWSALSYGRFQFGVDANRDAAGNPVIPTITPANNNGDDWGNIAAQIVQLNPERIWQISGSWVDGGKRVIPSVVLVQQSETHASAPFQWNFEFTSGGQNYRVGDLFHIRFDTQANAEGLPRTWGTMAHEYGHNFLEGYDLYGSGGGKVAYWDLLGDGSAPGRMSDTSSFYKARLGWLSFKNVVQGPTFAASEFRLRPYATTGEAIKVVPDPVNNPGEYWLLEYRTKTGDERWSPDGDIRESGLLITHINDRLGDGASGVVATSPFMDIEEADGNDGKAWWPEVPDRSFDDLPWNDPAPATPGAPGAAAYEANNWPDYNRGVGVLYPFNGNDCFTPETTPNSNFYGGRDSGLRITNIRKVGDEMVFTVELTGNNQSVYQLSNNDRYLTGDFNRDGKDEVLAYNGRQLALIDSNQNQYQAYWQANEQLGSWRFSPLDALNVGDFNGDGRADLFAQRDGRASLFLSDGQALNQVWASGDPARNQNWVGAWHLGDEDRTWTGDFDGDGKDDIFIRSPQWAGILRSTGEGFELAWISGDPARNQDWVGNWHLGALDKHAIGDFDGDGRDDVFAANSGWAAIWRSTGQGFEQLWMSGDPARNQNWVGNWHLGRDDKYFLGDYNGDGRQDIFIRSDQWAALLVSTGTGLQNVWMTGDPTQGGNRIDTWQLGAIDRHLVADLNGDGRDDVFIRNGPRAAHLISDGTGFHVEWRDDHLGLDTSYLEVAGRFNYDRWADVFLSNGRESKGLTTLVDPNSRRTQMSWSWQSGSRLATKAPPAAVDQFFTADFTGDGKDDVLAFNGTRLALYQTVNGKLQRIGLTNQWVGGWNLGRDNWLQVGDFTGDGKADVYVRSPHWAGLLASTGTGFTNVWMTGDPAQNRDWIGQWHLGSQDSEQVGDFNADGKADIFIRSPHWAALLLSTGSGFQNVWMTGDPAQNRDWIGQWHLGAQDREFVGDFNGDGKADLYVRSPNWAGLLISTGTGFSNVWLSGDPAQNRNWVGQWRLGPQDREYVGDFDGDGKDDLFIRSRQWAGLLISTGTTFRNVWISGDPAMGQNRIGNWQLSAADQHTIGDFNGDNKADVYIGNGRQAAVLLSTGAQFNAQPVQDLRAGTWIFSVLDGAHAGRFGDGLADSVFIHHPGGWTAVLSPVTGSGGNITLMPSQSHFREVTANDVPNRSHAHPAAVRQAAVSPTASVPPPARRKRRGGKRGPGRVRPGRLQRKVVKAPEAPTIVKLDGPAAS